MRKVNLETITDTLSWYKILSLSEFSRFRGKQRLHMRRTEVCQNSWNHHTNQKSFTLTTHWNLENHVKIQHGIIELQHLTDPRQNGNAKRAVRRVQEGTSAVLLQSGLDAKRWADSMECCCYLRDVQDLLAEGKTPYGTRFGKTFKGQIIPVGAMVEHLQISTRDLSRIHQLGKKVLPGIFLGYELIAGENLERRCSDCRFGRYGKVGSIRNLSSKNQREKSIDKTKR